MILAVALASVGCAGGGGGLREPTSADKRSEGAQVHTELGQRYMQNGDLQGALEKLNKALQFDPNYPPAHTVIAVLYERINDNANAELHYRRAVELEPKKGAANNNLAVFLCKEGKVPEAQGYFQRALADPFYATPDLAMGNAGTCLLKTQDLDGAEVWFRKALEKNPSNVDALYQVAHVLYLKNDAFRARAFLQRYEALGAVSPDSLKLGHDIELRLGNGEVARDYAKRLRDRFPDSEPARALDASAP
ncbi:type IV pilus biogenesis/stability protein PilW [Luteibacter rhizovicinus]|nr:type IV pilus biogenesis/stability protein PilW [Luteibacter rhizovicinus]